MKKYFNKGIAILAILVFISLSSVSVSSAIPILGITPDNKTVTAGDIFTLDVTVTDITDLGSFVFDLKFDPSILSVSSIHEGSFLPGAGFTTFNPGTFGSGEVGLISGDLLFGGASGSGVLASITFDALAVGTSSIILASAVLEDSDFPVSAIPFDLNPGFVEVLSPGTPPSPTPTPAPVPEPATMVLFGSGLLALIVRKMKASK